MIAKRDIQYIANKHSSCNYIGKTCSKIPQGSIRCSLYVQHFGVGSTKEKLSKCQNTRCLIPSCSSLGHEFGHHIEKTNTFCIVNVIVNNSVLFSMLTLARALNLSRNA